MWMTWVIVGSILDAQEKAMLMDLYTEKHEKEEGGKAPPGHCKSTSKSLLLRPCRGTKALVKTLGQIASGAVVIPHPDEEKGCLGSWKTRLCLPTSPNIQPVLSLLSQILKELAGVPYRSEGCSSLPPTSNISDPGPGQPSLSGIPDSKASWESSQPAPHIGLPFLEVYKLKRKFKWAEFRDNKIK